MTLALWNQAVSDRILIISFRKRFANLLTLASSPAMSESELHSKESVGSPGESGNTRSKQQFVPINATPIDKLYSMQNAYFSF